MSHSIPIHLFKTAVHHCPFSSHKSLEPHFEHTRFSVGKSYNWVTAQPESQRKQSSVIFHCSNMRLCFQELELGLKLH